MKKSSILRASAKATMAVLMVLTLVTGMAFAEAPASDISGKLSVFIPSGFPAEIVTNAMKELYPDLVVETDQIGVAEYETVLKTKLASGEAPDIMTVWPGSRTTDYAAKGYLEKLDDMGFAARISDTLNSEFSYEGNLYAMCYQVGMEGMYYNKNLFAQYGLEVPKDYDEFKSVSDAFLANGIQPLSSGFKEDWIIMRYTNSAFATLGYARNPNFDAQLTSGEITFDGPEWRVTFDRFREMLDAGYFGGNLLSTDNAQAIADFATGKTAMMIHTSSTIGEILDAGSDFEVGFTATPVNDKGETLFGMYKSGLGMAVSSSSGNKEAAKAYLETICIPEINEQIYIEMKDVAVLNDVNSLGVNPAISAFIDEFAKPGHTALGAHDRWPAGMSNNWKKKLQEFVGAQINTDEMVQWLNEEYEALK